MEKKLKTVLLVDDDAATNFLHSIILKILKCTETIDTARNGKEALDYLHENNPPDLILLDINMPGMDGWMFLDELDKLPEIKSKTKVIVMITSSVNPQDRLKALERGTTGFMSKPLTNEKAREMLSEHFPDMF